MIIAGDEGFEILCICFLKISQTLLAQAADIAQHGKSVLPFM